MGLADLPRFHEVPAEPPGQREELVRRVASSGTFEKSPRLRAFFLHVCQCALDNRPEAATEQQIGIRVYNRPPGYNPNDDNIVRSQARLLRLKLEHHFANEGKDETVVITIPKGRYLPVFENRLAELAMPPAGATAPATVEGQPLPRRILLFIVALIVVSVVALVWVANLLWRSKTSSSVSPAGVSSGLAPDARQAARGDLVAAAPLAEARVAAGNMGPTYTDVWGRRWESDRYYEGGISRPGPRELFPPVADPGLFKTIRESAAMEYGTQHEFRYHIPVKPGVYELRLYFADPFRGADVEHQEDAQNIRRFAVSSNGRPLLTGFDPTGDAGIAPVDIRVFKDITPADDGMVHLEFISGPDRPFVSAIELTPGVLGKLRPIRLSAHKNGFVDEQGTRWDGDNYFVDGRTSAYANPKAGSKVPELYTHERYGNFSYAIPVAPGTYTAKLHFAETFYNPLNAVAGLCGGAGCRVFDVTCNGVALLSNFDISQAAPGSFRPVVRTFRGLRPNGQGKLLLSFSPRVNYAEVRAIEVIDEAK
jgi:hypothetical protein